MQGGGHVRVKVAYMELELGYVNLKLFTSKKNFKYLAWDHRIREKLENDNDDMNIILC